MGAPVTIGTSAVTEWAGPDVAIAASSEGVVAAWSSRNDEVTTIALDASGRPRGQGRTMSSDARWGLPRLWELGDGQFVLAFVSKQSSSSGNDHVLQRVQANGEPVGNPVFIPFGSIKTVTPFRSQLLMLFEASLHENEILRVAATEGGLEVKRGVRFETPSETRLNVSIVPAPSGTTWVVAGHMRDGVTVDREGGERVEVNLSRDLSMSRPVVSEDGELLWMNCQNSPTIKGVKLHEGKPVEVELPGSVCHGPSVAEWRVESDDRILLDGKNQGLRFVLRPGPREEAISLTKEPREHWFVDSTWTGTSVLAIHATRKRNVWAIVVQPITCEGSAPPPSSATGANGTKN